MKKIFTLWIMMGAAISAAGTEGTGVAVSSETAAALSAPALKPQTHCPVLTDETVSRRLYVDSGGKRIYVCCKSCRTEVRKDPAKYLAALHRMGEEAEDAPPAEAVTP